MDNSSLADMELALRNFIVERFKIPENDPDFTNEVHLFDYGYIDSFGAVDLTAFVEKAFSVKVSESDMIVHPLNTILEIASFALKRRNKEI